VGKIEEQLNYGWLVASIRMIAYDQSKLAAIKENHEPSVMPAHRAKTRTLIAVFISTSITYLHKIIALRGCLCTDCA